MTQFLIMVAFGCMVWAGDMTILYIMACREIDQLKRDAKENAERAKFYSGYSNRRDADVHRLEKENANLSANLWLARSYAQKLRAATGAKCLEVNR